MPVLALTAGHSRLNNRPSVAKCSKAGKRSHTFSSFRKTAFGKGFCRILPLWASNASLLYFLANLQSNATFFPVIFLSIYHGELALARLGLTLPLLIHPSFRSAPLPLDTPLEFPTSAVLHRLHWRTARTRHDHWGHREQGRGNPLCDPTPSQNTVLMPHQLE